MELDRNFKNSNIKFLFDVWLPTLLEPRWYSISRSFTLLKSQTIKAYRCGLKIFRKKKRSWWLNTIYASFAKVNLNVVFIRISCNDVSNSEYSENVNATIETRANNWVQFVRVVRWWCWPLRRVGCARNFARSWINIYIYLERCASN